MPTTTHQITVSTGGFHAGTSVSPVARRHVHTGARHEASRIRRRIDPNT